jgi:hypothetical protein
VIVLSLILVIAAAVLLVVGIFQDGLFLIYLSIGSCLAAMGLLGIGVLVRRREGGAAATSGHGAPATAAGPAPAGPAPAVSGRPVEAPRSVREDATAHGERIDASSGAEERGTAQDRAGLSPATETATSVPQPGATAVGPAVAKRAVVKKAVVRRAAVEPAPTGRATVKRAVVRKTTGTTSSSAAANSSSSAAPGGSPGRGSSGQGGGLDAVKGLGPARRQALLDRFGDEQALRDASVEELTEVRGVGPRLAQAIKDALS